MRYLKLAALLLWTSGAQAWPDCASLTHALYERWGKSVPEAVLNGHANQKSWVTTDAERFTQLAEVQASATAGQPAVIPFAKPILVHMVRTPGSTASIIKAEANFQKSFKRIHASPDHQIVSASLISSDRSHVMIDSKAGFWMDLDEGQVVATSHLDLKLHKRFPEWGIDARTSEGAISAVPTLMEKVGVQKLDDFVAADIYVNHKKLYAQYPWTEIVMHFDPSRAPKKPIALVHLLKKQISKEEYLKMHPHLESSYDLSVENLKSEESFFRAQAQSLGLPYVQILRSEN